MRNDSSKITSNNVTYPPESAGRLMVSDVPIVPEHSTIEDIEKILVQQARVFESLSYIYVIDKSHVLKGVASIKELYRSAKAKLIKDVMQTVLVSARPHTDQERVALLALKHNIKSIPVVDKDGKMLGIVPTDTILNILHNESVEDALRSSGFGKLENPAVNIVEGSAWLHFRKRFPWLLVGLVGGVVAAFVVRNFETALRSHIILAAFIPAVVYMADAVGAQTQTIFIRSLSLTHRLKLAPYVKRELSISFFLALALGVIAYLLSLMWIQSATVALILGTTLVATVLSATAIALILPWVFYKNGSDPAIASGPFATVVRDILSLLIYFGIASLVLI